jgi:hypothetical protein
MSLSTCMVTTTPTLVTSFMLFLFISRYKVKFLDVIEILSPGFPVVNLSMNLYHRKIVSMATLLFS